MTEIIRLCIEPEAFRVFKADGKFLSVKPISFCFSGKGNGFESLLYSEKLSLEKKKDLARWRCGKKSCNCLISEKAKAKLQT